MAATDDTAVVFERTNGRADPLNNETQVPAAATHKTGNLSLLLLTVAERSIRNGSMSLKDFSLLQENDAEIQQYLATGARTVKKHENGLIFKNDKLYLPECLVRPAVECIHKESPGMHTPRTVTYAKLSAKYFRKHLKREVYSIYQDCFLCALAHPAKLPKQSLHAQYVATAPREAYYTDLCDFTNRLAEDAKIPRYAMVACDAYSSYLIVAPMQSKSKECIAETLTRHILAPMGKPKMIIADNESGLVSQHTQSILAANGIRCHLASPRNPQSVRVERYLQTLKKHLLPLLVQSADYTTILPTIMQCIKGSRHYA